jgi:hypothetical protein
MNAPVTMTNSAMILLVVASLSWLALMADLSTVVGQHPFGDRDIFIGVRWIFAGVMVFAACVCLGGVLLTASAQDLLPGWVSTTAAILCPTSLAAAIASLYLVSETNLRWPVVVPAAIPPVLIFFVCVLYNPVLRAAVEREQASYAVWGIVAALTISVAPVLFLHLRQQQLGAIESKRVMAEWEVQEKARKRKENLATLKKMTPDQELGDWFDLLDEKNGTRQEALKAYRRVERRQGDVQAYLMEGGYTAMSLVPDLGLKPTPELCAAAQKWLRKNSRGLRLMPGDLARPYSEDPTLTAALEGVRWFCEHRCDCSEGVKALEDALRTYADSPARQRVLEMLASLKPARN